MWFNGSSTFLVVCTHGQTGRWRMDRWTDRFLLELQDFIPFGAAALLPLNLSHTLLKQGMGTADHLLPLGCYFLWSSSLVECLLNDILDFHIPVLLWHKQYWRDNLSIINSGINVDLDTNIVLLQMVSKNALTDQTTDLYIVTCSTPNTMSLARNQTRPDTRQSSCRWLCRSSNVKTTRNSTRPDTRPIPVADGWAGAEMRVFTLSNSIITDGPTDGRTDGRTDGQSLL